MRSARRLTVSLVLVLAAPLLSDDAGVDDPLQAARRAIARLDFEAARAALDARIDADAAGAAADARLLRAVVRLQQDDPEGAVADLLSILDAAADRPVAQQARLLAADVLARLDRQLEALGVADEVVARLRADERRHAVARLYVDAADELLRPDDPAPEETPPYGAAYELLTKVEELDALGPSAADVRADLLRCADRLGRTPRERIDRATEFLAAHDGHPAAPEVQRLLGNAHRDANDLLAARDAWLALADRAPASPLAADALEQLAGVFLRSGLGDRADLEGAISALDRLATLPAPDVEARGTRTDLELQLARALAKRPELRPIAVARLERLATRPDAGGEARLLLAELAAEDGAPEEALALLTEVVAERPLDDVSRTAMRRIGDVAKAAFEEAVARGTADGGDARAAQFERARRLAERFVERSPTDPVVPSMARSLARLELLEGRVDEAIRRARDVARRFPGSDAAAEARLDVARWTAEEKGEFDAALDQLRTLEDGKTRAAARALREEITRPTLRLEPPRPVAVGARPAVVLHSRNVDEVEVQLHRVDLEAVFLAAGTLDGLTALDVGLIRPDETFTVVLDAAPHAPHERRIELPAFDGPGAAVVTARSGRLEARTAVIASDLDAFAVATARRTDVAADGVESGALRARVASGGRLLPGDESGPARGADQRRAVLALRDGHAALVPVATSGLAEAPPRRTRGWLVVDRDRARPGDEVRLFGLARRPAAADGALRIDWRDRRTGLLLRSTAADLGPTGGLSDVLEVDGSFRHATSVDVALVEETGDGDERTVARAVVEVGPFDDPAVGAVWTTPPLPLLCGETARLRATLVDGDGAPLAAERVEVALADESFEAVVTDAGGTVVLDVPARRTFLPGRVRARVRARGVVLERSVPVVSRAPIVAARDRLEDRSPLLAGVEVPLVFEVADARGAPVRTGLRVRAIAPDPVDGERVALDVTVRPDERGRAAVPYRPSAAGAHRVTVDVDGGRGLPVRTAWPLPVAGDGDGVPVSLLPATVRPERGAPLRLVIHSELDGDRPATLVLHDTAPRGERAITLPPGASEWTIDVPADARTPLWIECVVDGGEPVFAPSLALAPAVECSVLLESDRESVRAGDEVEVSLRATTGAGAGIAGEALVALVHEDELPGLAARTTGLVRALHPPIDGRFVAVGSSAAFVPPSVTVARDGAVEAALADLERAAAATGAAVMIEPLALDRILGDEELPGEQQEVNDTIGLGGGAGGAYGGRYGGRAGGRAQSQADAGGDGPPRHVPAPAVFRAGVRLSSDAPATVTLKAPERTGRWTVLAVAATAGGRVGIGTLGLDVDEPVQASLVLPELVRPGDAPRLAARLTEREGAAGNADLRLEVDGAEVERRTVALRARETVVQTFALPELGPGEHRVVLRVDGRPHEAVLRGVDEAREVLVSLSGAADGEAVLAAPPASRPRRLRIEASLLARRIDHALAPRVLDPRDAEAAAWTLWTAADALAAARAAGGVPDALLARLDEAARARLRSLAGLLPPRRDDERTAPIALAALERASAAGLDVPAVVRDPLAARVDAILSTATDPDRRAWLLFLAGRGGGAEFAMLNRLFRERESLGTTGLALLALALADAGRAAEAVAVLARLESQAVAGDLAPDPDGTGRNLAGEEFDAVVAAAARALDARSPAVDRIVRRAGAGSPPGPAAAPLVDAVGSFETPDDPARSVTVTSGGRTLAEVSLAGIWSGAEVPLPDDLGPDDLRLRAAGGGTFLHRTAWSSGPEDGADTDASDPVSVTRTVRRTVAVHDGRRMSISGRVVGPGGRVDLELETRRVVRGRPVHEWVAVRLGDAAGELWVDVPRPAWGTVDLTSVRGAEDVVVEGAMLRFLVRRPDHRASMPWIHYRVAPGAPGRYRTPSARLASARYGTRRPVRGGAEAEAEVVLVDPGEDPDAGVPMSPDERYHLGLAAHADGDPEAARAALLPLAELRLDAKPLLETARTLMLASAEVGHAEDTVRFFEILKERDPGYVVPFATMRRVGAAYRELGEPERARQIALAIVDATFLEEAQVVGRLESAGLARRAFAAMRRLLAEYGDTPAAAEVRFAFGMHAYDAAKATDPSFAGDDRRLDRETLFRLATDVLLQRLALAPRAPDREEVLLTLVNALVDAGRHAAGRDLAAAAAATLAPDSRLLASLRFVEAHASFALSDLDRALELGASLAEDRFPEGTALLDELRAMGRHLAAQVHHARGDLDAARRAYAAVRERFADAARALAWLEQRGLEIPRVTRARAGEPLVLTVEHRGDAATLEVKAFPIDLRALFLKHRGLDRLDEVRLEGIPPVHAEEFPLTGSAVGRVETDAELALDDAGAWLLLVRAGDLHARGLAVRSDLALEADAGPDTVRIHAVSAKDGRPRAGALVTFAGDRFSTRRTDLRGICEVETSADPVAAIAEADGHWAFLPIALPPRGAAAAEHAPAQQREDHLKRSQQVLEDARLRNSTIWTESTNRVQRGVEVERARK